MPVHVVYVDQVVLGSMVMNYVILRVVGKMGGVENGRWRPVAAAAVGGLYSLAAFIPAASSLLTIWVKMAVSLGIVFIAFAPLSPVRLAICLGFFYLASFALGGSVIGIMYLLGSGTGNYLDPRGFQWVVGRYFWHATVLAMAFFWIAGRGASRILKRRLNQILYKTSVTIKVHSKQVETVGLIDSGNQLTDPFNGNPVIVAEYEVIKCLLPEKVVTYLDGNKKCDLLKVLLLVKGGPWETRLRLIPFQSLGQDSGMLLGFNPDEVKLEREDTIVRTGRVTVAVYHKRLSLESAYHVLVHPGLLD